MGDWSMQGSTKQIQYEAMTRIQMKSQTFHSTIYAVGLGYLSLYAVQMWKLNIYQRQQQPNWNTSLNLWWKNVRHSSIQINRKLRGQIPCRQSTRVCLRIWGAFCVIQMHGKVFKVTGGWTTYQRIRWLLVRISFCLTVRYGGTCLDKVNVLKEEIKMLRIYESCLRERTFLVTSQVARQKHWCREGWSPSLLVIGNEAIHIPALTTVHYRKDWDSGYLILWLVIENEAAPFHVKEKIALIPVHNLRKIDVLASPHSVICRVALVLCHHFRQK